MSPSDVRAGLACVVLAHSDPAQLRRLVDALDPFPVFLHVDSATPDDVHHAMTSDLPARVTLLQRRRTAWAGWQAVEAELDGYRAALATTDASHVALLSGSDYPLVSTAEISGYLASTLGRSTVFASTLPIPAWGWGGGAWRFRFRWWAWRKRPVPFPVPRPLPAGVVPAGGSTQKLLAREHAAGLLDLVGQRPDLLRFWRRAWAPDESLVPSLLHSPALMPGVRDRLVGGSAWFIGWDGSRTTSPPWLTLDDLPAIEQQRADPWDGVPKLFARKFATDVDTALLDALDRARGATPPAPAAPTSASGPLDVSAT